MTGDSPQHLELLRSLGRLSRGLSALFWGLPVTLLIFVRTSTKARTEAEPLDLLGPILTCCALLYGIFLLGSFRPNERVWQQALDRTRIFSFCMLGLSPFLYFKIRLPEEPFFAICSALLALVSFLFLGSLNFMLQRLSAMLPEQTLRHEIRFFTVANLYLLALFPVILASYTVLLRWSASPSWIKFFLQRYEMFNPWLLLFLFLLPLAMTMSLIWKTRQVVLHGIFGED